MLSAMNTPMIFSVLASRNFDSSTDVSQIQIVNEMLGMSAPE